MVSALEDYLFDLNGYVVVKDALPADQLAEINATIDAYELNDPAKQVARGHNKAPLQDHAVLRSLIDNPTLMPYLEAWVSSPLTHSEPAVRLDHAYFIFSQPGANYTRLHLGATPYVPAASYHVQNGKIFSALTVVSYVLNEVLPGQGGFACIPGSHKSQFPCPHEIIEFENTSFIVSPAVEPGDAIVFTEALTHGAFGWSAPHQRRALFYKYAPAHMAWVQPRWSESLVEKCTERQRMMLQPARVDPRSHFFD